MDFGSLLRIAQENEHKAKLEPKKCYSTSFSAPKKEPKLSSKLSSNIQKFLARKEEEKKEKELEEKRKRDKLLALRAQDSKAKKRIACMLKLGKGASKSVMDDAMDNNTITGASQPDEDDYGFVSQEASAYYDKLMEKYNQAPPEEPLYSPKKKVYHADLNSVKERVKMALIDNQRNKVYKQRKQRRKRKQRSKIKPEMEDDPGDMTLDCRSSDRRDLSTLKDCDRALDRDQEHEARPEKPKVRKPPPPPALNFQELLKLAEKKQFEPIAIEPKIKPKEDDARPMTKKQKKEFLREQEWRQRKMSEASAGPAAGQTTSNPSHPPPPPRIPKISNREDSSQNQKADKVDKAHEKPSGVLQMKIPKIQNSKREGKPLINSKEDERSANSMRKEERYMNNVKKEQPRGSHPNPPCHNGSLSRDHSTSLLLKSNATGNDVKRLKKIARDNDVSRNPKFKNEAPERHKALSQDDDERNKGYRNDRTTSNSKCLPGKVSEVTKQGTVATKNRSTSGYDRKLQDAIETKMQEYQKKKSGEETSFTKANGRVSRNDEKSSLNAKTQEKVLPRTDKFVVNKSNVVNQKVRSSGHSGASQELQPQNRSKPVLSAKGQAQPSEGISLSSPLPSNTRTYLPGDLRAKAVQDTGAPRQPAATSAERSRLMPPPEARSKQMPTGAQRKTLPQSDLRPKQFPPADMKPKQLPPADMKPKQLPPADMKPKQLPPADMKPKQFPPGDIKPKQFPPADVRPRQFPPADVRRRPKPPMKRRIMDSEEEYDPEMDDFIDDGPEEQEDYSQHIREIFGYDRRKYSRIEDDDECMESNFATILKEDYISTKTGILEDLEDIRREKEMEKRKKLAKKRKP